MEHFWTVAAQVLVLFLLIAVGYGCGKTRLLREETLSGITDLVLYVVTPCVIVKSFLRPFEPAMLQNLLIVAAAATAIHLLAMGLAHLCIRRGEPDRRKVAQFAVVFSNAGYMCLPLQQALFGDDGVFYGSVYVALFNVALWTYGFLLMRRQDERLPLRRLLCNPGLLGVAAGLLIFCTSLPVPTVLSDAIGHLAVLNTPLPMLIIGCYLAQSDLLAALRDRAVYLPVFLRLVVVPLLSLLGMWACGLRDVPLLVCVIAASAPVAAATTLFSGKFGRDAAFSVRLIAVSTPLSILTMPLFVLLAQTLAG